MGLLAEEIETQYCDEHHCIKQHKGIEYHVRHCSKASHDIAVRVADIMHDWHECVNHNIHRDAYHADVLQYKKKLVAKPDCHASDSTASHEEAPWQSDVCEVKEEGNRLEDIDNIHQHIVEEVAREEQHPKRWVRNVDPSTNSIEPALAATRLGNTKITQEAA